MHICPSSRRTTVLHCKYGQLTESQMSLKKKPHPPPAQSVLLTMGSQSGINSYLFTPRGLQDHTPASEIPTQEPQEAVFSWLQGPSWTSRVWNSLLDGRRRRRRRSFPSSRIFKFLGLFTFFLQHFSLYFDSAAPVKPFVSWILWSAV